MCISGQSLPCLLKNPYAYRWWSIMKREIWKTELNLTNNTWEIDRRKQTHDFKDKCRQTKRMNKKENIPDPIDDGQFQQWEESGKDGILLANTRLCRKCGGKKASITAINIELQWKERQREKHIVQTICSPLKTIILCAIQHWTGYCSSLSMSCFSLWLPSMFRLHILSSNKPKGNSAGTKITDFLS